MSNINILQFQEDRQPKEWRKLYHSARKRNPNILFKNEHSQSWRTLLKMCLNKNSFDLSLISLVFYIRNSLEKQTENSEVLLNCHDRKSLWVVTCNTSFAIPHWILFARCVWFHQLRYRLHVCLRALKRKYIWSDLHFIIDEKREILHFKDEDKTNLGDLQFYIDDR